MAESCLGRINQLKKADFAKIHASVVSQGGRIIRRNQIFWLQERLSEPDRQGPDRIYQFIGFIDYNDHLEEQQYYQEQDEEVL
jgi:hypothetical protein